MSKRQRVYELAKDLGYANQEMVTRINELDLGIRVSNIMTYLSKEEVTKVTKALEKSKSAKASSAPAEAPKEEAKAASSKATLPTRRRRTKAAAAAAADTSETAPESPQAVGPTIRKSTRRRVADELVAAAEAAPEQAEAQTPPAPPEPLAPPAEPRAPEQDAKATPAPKSPEVKAPEPAPRREAPSASARRREEPRVQAKILSHPAPAPVPVPTPETPPPTAAAPAAARADSQESPAAAKRPAEPKKGAAVTLGRMDLGTLRDRIGERDFEAPAGRDDKNDSRRRNKSRDRSDVAADRPGRHRDNSSRTVRELDSLYGRGKGKGRRGKVKEQKRSKKTEITMAAEHKRVVKIEDTITVGELGRQMSVKSGHIALKLMEMGLNATVNTTLDFDTATLIALEFDHTVENVAFDITKFYDTSADEMSLQTKRPPVVTVMGHVDHGKTSLLDALRSANVLSGEAGGITQHIGAYMVEVQPGESVTFLDTPGHEAFTALRARGAQATDIVVLVVAADDGVMPQTVEAINHAKEAGVPIIVAINKIDKPAANPDRIKQALTEYELIPEAWSGQTQYVEVSALQGTNIGQLLEEILLRAEIEEFKARTDRDAQGVVIESQLDVGRGPLATLLVQRGTLKRGDILVIGEQYGRVRTMMDYKGDELDDAGPSVPVEVTGLGGVPEAGEPFFVAKDERSARMITGHAAEQQRQMRMAALSKSGMDKLRNLISEGGERKKLKVIVKGDVQGSIEALRHAFSKIGNEEASVEVIHSAVGGVTENDVNLAASSEDTVVIVGFNVRPDNRATEVAEKYGIYIFTFSIIYEAIDKLRDLVEGLLSPIEEENILGQAEVRETFHAPKVGTIAGCLVTKGVLRRDARARLYRDGKLVYTSKLASLRRFKDDAKEVRSGFECGTSLENYNDVKVGDVIEAFELIEVAATL